MINTTKEENDQTKFPLGIDTFSDPGTWLKAQHYTKSQNSLKDSC